MCPPGYHHNGFMAIYMTLWLNGYIYKVYIY